MKAEKLFTFKRVAGALFVSLAVMTTALPVCAAAGAYEPEQWNIDARKKFADQRFGIFIHWGLYANYAQGEWYLQQSRLDEKAYSRMKDGFYPSKFDAREWVKVFKDAGAKYVTVTSRHHDGFSLWPTKADDGYNIMNTPFRRDILGELAAACREADLQLNFYYSIMDWHRTDYPAGTVSKYVLGNQKGDYDSYKKFMKAQITELIDSYSPGNIWFDGEWDHAVCNKGKWHDNLDWHFDELYDLIHSKKVLVANNNHRPIRPKEDIQLFERDLPGEHKTGFSKNQTIADDRPIEQCDVIQKGVWGYRIGEKSFRTPQEVCTMICRAAAKNTNLLMNIGPDGSGRLPEKAVEVMAEVGKWMKANGDAIYDTRGAGIVKDKDGVEILKTKKDGRVFTIKALPGKYPEVLRTVSGGNTP